MLPKNALFASLKKQDGFSLVEVVIASLVAAISLAGVWGLIHWIMYSTYITTKKTEAAQLASAKMEQILQGAVTSGSDSTNEFIRTWSVSDSGALQRNISVTVRFVDVRGNTNSMSFTSALIRPVSSGGGQFSEIFTGAGL